MLKTISRASKKVNNVKPNKAPIEPPKLAKRPINVVLGEIVTYVYSIVS